MDNLYENLDNYEDLNVIEQLKNENADLKNKLEGYAIAMDKLQKDFDRVSSDFKKLEMNYSSLLKTAKVEIERKTKIIKDLNTEKDMIVIKALQNKNIQNVRSIRSITKPFQKGPMTDSNFVKKNMDPSADNVKDKSDSGISARKEENRFSSVDTVTSSNTEIADRLLKLACGNAENADLWSDRTSDTKENIAKKDVEDSSTNVRSLSIRNRRKSMPAVRAQAKFSSDEECEDSYHRNETYKKRFPPREDRQIIDKSYNDRYRNKVSEPTRDERYGYEPNREAYHRNRNEKYGIDKFKSRDRFDNTQRHRRYSPDRSRRLQRTGGYFQRQEFERQRYLESPPPDKFHHHQQRNRESRSNYEKDDLSDFERGERHQEPNPIKHKIVSEHFEEPISKRQRTDTLNRNVEDTRWTVEKGVALEKSVSDLLEEMPQYTSCQSPDDYLLSDASSPLPVKEIMNTASTPLEDPRIHSKKYTLKTVDKNTTLSTVIGRNVDLKLVDLNKWAINKQDQVEVPKALTKRPSQSNNEIIKEICMDIDNPVSNMSVESGEILTSPEDDPDNNDIGQFKSRGTKLENEKDIKMECDNLLPKVSSKNLEKDVSLFKPYRIPKIKDKDQPRPISSIVTSHRECKKQSKSDLKMVEIDTHFKTHKVDDVQKVIMQGNNDKDSSLKYAKKDTDPIAVSKEIIAGDLELSDETCDNMEFQRKTLKESTSSQIKSFKKDKQVFQVHESLKNTVEDKVLEHNTHTLTKDPVKQTKVKTSDIAQVDSKKQRGRKKSTKIKDKCEQPVGMKEKVEPVLDTNDKVKKDKKTKFNELFGGDSNSIVSPEDLCGSNLITPDDLGIAIQVEQQPLTKYISICEDAQDAVDVNVKETKIPKLKILLEDRSLTKSKTLKPNDVNVVSEIQTNITESKPQNKSKTSCDSKKRKSKKSETEEINVSAKSQDREFVKDMITSVSEKPILISPTETQTRSVPVIDTIQKEIVDNLRMFYKPDKYTSMNALATSTPEKALRQEGPESEKASGILESLNNPSSNEISVNNLSAEQSSTAENVEAKSVNNDDVPDVRIFVKRRRRVLKKPL